MLLCRSLCTLQADMEYMDDNAEKLARQKMRSDAMKRQFAIHGTMTISDAATANFQTV